MEVRTLPSLAHLIVLALDETDGKGRTPRLRTRTGLRLGLADTQSMIHVKRSVNRAVCVTTMVDSCL